MVASRLSQSHDKEEDEEEDEEDSGSKVNLIEINDTCVVYNFKQTIINDANS